MISENDVMVDKNAKVFCSILQEEEDEERERCQ